VVVQVAGRSVQFTHVLQIAIFSECRDIVHIAIFAWASQGKKRTGEFIPNTFFIKPKTIRSFIY
jgi:hypothetical protein